MNLPNLESHESDLEKIREKFVEIETRLRRQMVVNPKCFLLAGSLCLSKDAVRVHTAAKLGTPFYLSLAAASLGFSWLSSRWWKARSKRGHAPSRD